MSGIRYLLLCRKYVAADKETILFTGTGIIHDDHPGALSVPVSRMKGECVLTHPDMQRANEWILREYRVYVRDFCVFVPVSGTCPVT